MPLRTIRPKPAPILAPDLIAPQRNGPIGSTAALRARVLLLVAALGWGLATTGTKYALDGFDPMSMLTVKLAAAAGTLWVIMLARGGWSAGGQFTTTLRRSALLGVLEPGLAYGGLTVALAYTSAANAAVISVAESCFVILLAWPVLRERPRARALVGVIIAAVGVVALSRFDIAAGFTVGDALVLAASAAAAGYVVLAARVVRAEDPVLVTTIQFSFAALLTIMVTSVLWATGAARVPTGVPVRYWIVAVIIGGLGYAGSFVLYNHALRIVSASTAGVVLNLVPVIGVLSAGVLLGEALTVWHLIGTLLVTAGVFLAPVGSSGPPPPATRAGG